MQKHPCSIYGRQKERERGGCFSGCGAAEGHYLLATSCSKRKVLADVIECQCCSSPSPKKDRQTLVGCVNLSLISLRCALASQGHLPAGGTADPTEGSGHKRSLSDVYGHLARPRKLARRKHRQDSPMRSVGSGASSSGFHKDGDRSGGEEANCPRVTR
jgi:hypothetical protein